MLLHTRQRTVQPTVSPTLEHTSILMASLDRLSHVTTDQQADVLARLAAIPESVRLLTGVQSVALVSKRARLRRVRGLSAEYTVAVHCHGPRTRRWFRGRSRRSRPVQSVGREPVPGPPRRVSSRRYPHDTRRRDRHRYRRRAALPPPVSTALEYLARLLCLAMFGLNVGFITQFRCLSLVGRLWVRAHCRELPCTRQGDTK